jgi:predicted DNA-binding transcriptional regulator YafY
LRDQLDSILLYAPGGFHMAQHLRERLDILHAACLTKRAVAFGYAREDGERSSRCVRPLALSFWTGSWTLASWCELRKDFRAFRIDRMEDVLVLERTFVPRRGQRLEDFIKAAMKKPNHGQPVNRGSVLTVGD